MSTIVAHAPGDPVALGEGATTPAADLAATRAGVATSWRGPPARWSYCSDRYHFAAALLGSWAAGHVVRLPPNGQLQAVRASAGAGVRALLHDIEGAEGTHIPELLRARAPEGELEFPPRPPPGDNHHLGQHRRAPELAQDRAAAGGRGDELVGKMFGVRPGSRVLSTVPPHHIYGLLWGVLMPLRAGAAMLREGPLHAEAVLAHRASTRHPPGVGARPPGGAGGGRPRVAGRDGFSSGAPLPAATAGASASATAGAWWRPTAAPRPAASAGASRPELWTPFPGDRWRGEDGVLLSSPRSFPPGAPVPAGGSDLAGGGGRFALLGRMDGVVKVAGKRVSLREVEERLLASPASGTPPRSRAPPGLRGEEIWVAVAATGQSPDRLREALAAWLEPVALPRRIRVLDSLPREATGKLVREKLRALFRAGRAPQPPRHGRRGGASAPAGKEVRGLTFRLPPTCAGSRATSPAFRCCPGWRSSTASSSSRWSGSGPAPAPARQAAQVQGPSALGSGTRWCWSATGPDGGLHHRRAGGALRLGHAGARSRGSR